MEYSPPLDGTARNAICSEQLYGGNISDASLQRVASRNHGEACWHSLRRGRASLGPTMQLDQHLHSCGPMTWRQWRQFLPAVRMPDNDIHLINYGCGQVLDGSAAAGPLRLPAAPAHALGGAGGAVQRGADTCCGSVPLLFAAARRCRRSWTTRRRPNCRLDLLHIDEKDITSLGVPAPLDAAVQIPRVALVRLPDNQHLGVESAWLGEINVSHTARDVGLVDTSAALGSGAGLKR